MRNRSFELRPHHERVVALTGAGLSAAAGLATFRGPGGIWEENPDLEAAMDVSRLPGNVPILWRVWGSVFERALIAGPTPGHRALAALDATILTQNVDGLHQFAGSHDVAELHGSAAEAVCLNPECTWRAQLAVRLDPERDPSDPEHYGVPRDCPVCGALMRPDIVLFGEMLPSGVLEYSENAARNCDVFLAVGTSNTVAPASLLAPLARASGAVTVCIDPYADSDRLAGVFDYVVREDAHTVLARWAEHRGRERRNPFLDPF
ncbi:hypothetical protein HMPREF1484_01382 [Dermabacter sp. HFH0086]|uniref:SIR2 family NAD-dependent protein deacylase n=1 Tax=Dermabacter TaxID=36739 RepID=UPI0003534280|nr:MULTISPECIES: Sir2 family NAD-dependent protein deacetylase [Dermabacter]EPH15745.1 hypothetical protein HMPREF1484_01382 [Dermabacter sp. HFH0086]